MSLRVRVVGAQTNLGRVPDSPRARFNGIDSPTRFLCVLPKRVMNLGGNSHFFIFQERRIFAPVEPSLRAGVPLGSRFSEVVIPALKCLLGKRAQDLVPQPRFFEGQILAADGLQDVAHHRIRL